jgi:glycosyltransferase involved in cell wall biosynthesis
VRVVLFGTYDAAAHPRVLVLVEGLRDLGVEVLECNAPLGLSTAARVRILRQPWRLPQLAARLATCWLALARRARRLPPCDAVVVGYLGHFDIHLARLLFRRTPLLLDHLVGAADTARDRGVQDLRAWLLTAVDRAALGAADVVLVDTDEHLASLPAPARGRALVVAVGADARWFAAGAAARTRAPDGAVLRVVFFGLFTPLQGAPVIAAAALELGGAGVELTMVGAGQEFAAARAIAGPAPWVRWVNWVPPADLPALVAGHDVSLGIFGTGPKALRVVPNKVFQSAAAGTALVTSDTAPQRRLLGAAALLVAPGDPVALADVLRSLAADRAETDRLRDAARQLAEDRFRPAAVVAPLAERLARLT